MMHKVIICLVLNFQLGISMRSVDMDDFISNTLQTTFCSFIGDYEWNLFTDDLIN